MIASARIVARQQGWRRLVRLSWTRLRGFVRLRRALAAGPADRAAYLETLLNDRFEFDHISIGLAAVELCDPRVLRLFCFRRFADLIAAYSDRADGLDQLALLLLCDALYTAWDYRALAEIADVVRARMLDPVLAKRVDNMIRRAQISSGRISAGEQGLMPQRVGSMADFLLRGDVWNAYGRMDLATEAYRRAVEAQADNPMVRLHLGFHLLKKGEIAEGLVCWGLAERIFGHYPLRLKQPVWRGEPLDDKALLIVFEHGFGDMVQFARYLVPLRQRFPHASLTGLVPAPIVGLLAQSFPSVEFIDGKKHVVADFHIAATQLPLLVGGSMYDPRRYLVARREASSDNRSGLRVGVCWRGHPRQYEQSRSIAVDLFSQLFSTSGAEFVCLLNTITSTERAHLTQFANVALPSITDFATLADEIAACHVIVTVDTSIVHLAGALGKRTILLSRPDACWRWGARCATSAWYDDVTVVRHPLDLDWPCVLAEAQTLIDAAVRQRELARIPAAAVA